MSDKSYLLWFLIAVLLAAIIFALCPNNTLFEILLESALLSVSCSICYLASHWQNSNSRTMQHDGNPWLLVVYLGLVGTAQLVFSLFEDDAVLRLWTNITSGSGVFIILICGLAAMSVFTGVFEECLIRGLLFPAAEDEYRRSRYATIIAASASSLVFGLLHVASDLPMAFEMDVVILLSIIAKLVQASLFGFVMCSVLKTHGIIWCIVAHALFDFIVFLPDAIIMEAPVVSYATSSMVGLLGILCSTLLLLPLVLKSWQTLVHDVG